MFSIIQKRSQKQRMQFVDMHIRIRRCSNQFPVYCFAQAYILGIFTHVAELQTSVSKHGMLFRNGNETEINMSVGYVP